MDYSKRCDMEQPQKMDVRVYKYGLVPLDRFPEEGVDQLYLAKRLRSYLVELHNKTRKRWNEARCDADPVFKRLHEKLRQKNQQIDDAHDKLRTIRMQEGTKDENNNPRLKDQRKVINGLKKERGEIYEEMKIPRAEADKKIDKKAFNDDYKRRFNEMLKVKNNGLMSDTAGKIGENFKDDRNKAFKDNARLRFHRFDGTGFFQFRCRNKNTKDNRVTTDGISVQDFMNANFQKHLSCHVLSVDKSRKVPRLHIRAKLAGGNTKKSKVFCDFHCLYHRPMPEDGQIQNGQILHTRHGDKFRYDLVLTVRCPKQGEVNSDQDQGVIGIDMGWRELPDRTIRVAMIARAKKDTEDISTEEICLPKNMLATVDQIEDLMGELDEAATELGKIITKQLKECLKTTPLSDDEENKDIRSIFTLCKKIAHRKPNVSLSFEQAYKLARRLLPEDHKKEDNKTETFRDRIDNLDKPVTLSERTQDLDFPEAVTRPVILWWCDHSRNYRKMHNMRRKCLGRRKHLYRELAARLVSENQLIAVEKLTLSGMAKTKDENTKLSNKSRYQRFLSAPSEYLAALENAAKRENVPIIKINPRYTSKRCSSCGEVNKGLESEQIWTCPACGAQHDRDKNAAINIARIGGQDYLKKWRKKTRTNQKND